MELIYAVIKHISALAPDINIPRINDIDAFHIGENEVKDLNKWVNNYLSDHIHEIIDETFNSSIPIREIKLEFEQTDGDKCYDMYFLTERTLEYLMNSNLITQESLTELVLNKNRYYGVLILRNDIGEIKEKILIQSFLMAFLLKLQKG